MRVDRNDVKTQTGIYLSEFEKDVRLIASGSERSDEVIRRDLTPRADAGA
jgi:hypothetical protein